MDTAVVAIIERRNSVESDQFYDASSMNSANNFILQNETRIPIQSNNEDILIEVPSSSTDNGASNVTEVILYYS